MTWSVSLHARMPIQLGEGLTHVLSKMILATGSGGLTCQYKTLGKGFKSIAFKFGKSRPFQIFNQKGQDAKN